MICVCWLYLSHLAAANGFVRSRPLGPTPFSPSQTASRSVHPFLHSSPVRPTHTDRQTTLRATSVATCRIYVLRTGDVKEKTNPWADKAQKVHPPRGSSQRSQGPPIVGKWSLPRAPLKASSVQFMTTPT